MEIQRKGDDLYLIPKVHQFTIIWLPGFNTDAEYFLPFFQNQELLPNCKIIILSAGKLPIPWLKGQLARSWFILNSKTQRVNQAGLKNSIRINEILQQEARLTNKLILSGFSQGGVMALYVGLQLSNLPLSAIMSISGFAMNLKVSPTQKNIPVLTYHGLQDPIIDYIAAITKYRIHLSECNHTHFYEDKLDHSISRGTIDTIRLWLATVIK